jgi:hypothetical protein
VKELFELITVSVDHQHISPLNFSSSNGLQFVLKQKRVQSKTQKLINMANLLKSQLAGYLWRHDGPLGGCG